MRKFVAVAMILSMTAGQASAACWEVEEYEAARMRDLQTVLMVSALKCGHSDKEMPAAYNRWVGRARVALLEGEKKLLAHFVREGDKLKYDRFTTALANKYSELAENERFCARAKQLMAADDTNNGVLAEVALLLNSRPNGVEDMCPAKKPTGSQIVISPFDPLPVAAAPAAGPSAPAPQPEPAVPAAPPPAPPAETPAG